MSPLRASISIKISSQHLSISLKLAISRPNRKARLSFRLNLKGNPTPNTCALIGPSL